MINWDCEFFEGENEQKLLAATLNEIEPERLEHFKKMLNEYLDWNAPGTSIDRISFDGCEDTTVHLANGKAIAIDSETTFREILALARGA